MQSPWIPFFICSYWSCGCAFVRTYHIAEQLIARKSLPDPCAIDQGFTREALARFTSVACRSVRSVAYVCGQRNIEETTTWKESYQDAISPLPITTSYRRTRNVEHICFIAYSCRFGVNIVETTTWKESKMSYCLSHFSTSLTWKPEMQGTYILEPYSFRLVWLIMFHLHVYPILTAFLGILFLLLLTFCCNWTQLNLLGFPWTCKVYFLT
jgi:hypothetical protein